MSRKGFPWSEQEDTNLEKEFLEFGLTLETIADLHCRTIGAIESRTSRMELVRPEWYLFVFELVEGRYYVGVTQKPMNLMKEFILDRQEGQFAWLDRYPVVEKLELFPIRHFFEVDQKVKHYMYRFGLNRVRGGSYSSLNLDETQIQSLRRELSFVRDYDQLGKG